MNLNVFKRVGLGRAKMMAIAAFCTVLYNLQGTSKYMMLLGSHHGTPDLWMKIYNYFYCCFMRAHVVASNRSPSK